MADTKTSALTAATTVDPADLVMTVDVSDTSMAASGTNKKATREQLQTYAAGTLTTDKKVADYSATWNNGAVAFTGVKVAITDTASDAASAIADLQVGGSSKFKVGKDGAVTAAAGVSGTTLTSTVSTGTAPLTVASTTAVTNLNADLLDGNHAAAFVTSASLGTGVGTALAVNTGSAGAFVVNGGALGTPSSGTLTNATGLPVSTGVSGLGTGVATALAVNTGSAGAVVVNGGALGTPSSGTLTNATGLPVSTGVSGLGTGVATALAVNTGSSGAFVVNGGALGTPSSGTVTNLTGTASININGTVGATTANTGAFTTLSATGVATFSAGTVTAPAITTSGDTNNGIYFPAADNVAITTGGTQRLLVDSSGNVGIGTSSPTAKLDVVTSANLGANYLNLAYDTGGGSGWIGGYNVTYNSGVKNVATGALNAIWYSSDSVRVYTNSSAAAGTTASERMRIDSSGNLLLGTSSTNSVNVTGAHIYGSGNCPLMLRHTGATSGRRWEIGPGSDNIFVIYNQDGAGVYLTNGGTSWNANSDERIKDIIEPISNAAEKVCSLRAVIGKYKKDEDGVRRPFLIAQDVQKVLPEAVNAQNDEIGTLGLAYTDTIPLLVAAIQEQQQQIDALKAEVAALKGNA